MMPSICKLMVRKLVAGQRKRGSSQWHKIAERGTCRKMQLTDCSGDRPWRIVCKTATRNLVEKKKYNRMARQGNTITLMSKKFIVRKLVAGQRKRGSSQWHKIAERGTCQKIQLIVCSGDWPRRTVCKTATHILVEKKQYNRMARQGLPVHF